jgi:hypothetical protein
MERLGGVPRLRYVWLNFGIFLTSRRFFGSESCRGGEEGGVEYFLFLVGGDDDLVDRKFEEAGGESRWRK